MRANDAGSLCSLHFFALDAIRHRVMQTEELNPVLKLRPIFANTHFRAHRFPFQLSFL